MPSRSPPLHQSRLFGRDPLQQFRRRFIRRILLDQLAPHGEVQHEPAQAVNGVRRVRHTVVEGEQPIGVHRNSASVRIPFNWSRTDITWASALVSSSRSVSGSP